MEFEYEGKTFWVEWESHEEIYVTDSDGNDVEYDYGLYAEAASLVMDEYVGIADMMIDMAKDEAMGL
jgi:hypothetical protein